MRSVIGRLAVNIPASILMGLFPAIFTVPFVYDQGLNANASADDMAVVLFWLIGIAMVAIRVANVIGSAATLDPDQIHGKRESITVSFAIVVVIVASALTVASVLCIPVFLYNGIAWATNLAMDLVAIYALASVGALMVLIHLLEHERRRAGTAPRPTRVAFVLNRSVATLSRIHALTQPVTFDHRVPH